jgi:putative transcriptional regulator
MLPSPGVLEFYRSAGSFKSKRQLNFTKSLLKFTKSLAYFTIYAHTIHRTRPPGAALPVKNRIHVLRAEMRWTQAELADRLKVSRQTINALETGKYAPGLVLAFRIARLFGKPVEEVFLHEEMPE